MAPRRRAGGLRKRMGRKRRVGRRMAIRRPLAARKQYQGVKYFTEVFNAGTLSAGGGIFTCALSSMLNHTQYFGLFDLGTITRFDVMLVPLYGDIVAGTSAAPGRLTWSTSQNTDVSTPGNELQLLQNSDSKTVPLDGKRKIVIKCYKPKAQIQGVTPAGAILPYVPKRSGWDWLDLNNATGQNTLFMGIPYFLTQPLPADPGYQVLIKVYAAFKEQN